MNTDNQPEPTAEGLRDAFTYIQPCCVDGEPDAYVSCRVISSDATGSVITTPIPIQKELELVPVTLAEANAFVKLHHRHHQPVIGHKFSIGLSDGEAIRGIVIVGRPVSRHLDNGLTLEVNRCCTDGIRNGCSKLYRAAWRVA